MLVHQINQTARWHLQNDQVQSQKVAVETNDQVEGLEATEDAKKSRKK